MVETETNGQVVTYDGVMLRRIDVRRVAAAPDAAGGASPDVR